MKKKKVLSLKSLPAKLPITSTVTCALALYYWKAPEWLWGVFGILFAFAWVTVIFNKVIEEEVDFLKTLLIIHISNFNA